MEYTAKETFIFDDLSSDEQLEVVKYTKESYLSYIFLWKSGKQHNKLKLDFQNNFTTGDDRYPNNRQQTLMLPEKYTKYCVIQQTVSEGTSFDQRGGDRNKQLPSYDKNIGRIWNASDAYRTFTQYHIGTETITNTKSEKHWWRQI